MKRTITILTCMLLLCSAASAQLAAGDIAFIGYNTDSGPGTNDNFAFITLTDIPGSEVIYFTEEGWNNITNSWAGTTEGHITYTTPAAGLSCGTIVHINESSANNFTVTGGGTATLSSGTSWSLSGGDQVLAYQALTPEPATTPTFIAGVHGDDGNGAPITLDPVTFWNTASLTPLGTARSEQPAGLTNGTNCVALFNAVGTEDDNAKYTGTLTGTSTALRAAINDRTNWATDNSTAYAITPSDYTASVTCVAPCSDPNVPTLTFSPATVCDGDNATITISGSLNDATAWHIYTGSCGGTLLGTTAGSTFIVTPALPSTTYFVRGEGGCVSPGSCGSVTISVSSADDASFSYSASTYCPNGTDPSPTITGTPGGTFTSSPAGLVINGSTGEIDLSASTENTYTITYTTSGACPANSNTNITIEDNTAPVPDLATLPDITAECEVTSLTSPTATDNCGGTVTVTHGTSLPIVSQGTTIVTWTYDDGNGNTSTQTQNVIIDDVTPPTPTLATLPDVTADCEVTGLIAPSATDNCGGTVTIMHDAMLPITAEGTTVVTWTYDDGNGNTSTQTQNVIIDDITAPVADLATLADITAECEVTSLTAPTATDNCGGTVTVTNDASLPITGEGTTVITWTYDDGNGNTSTQTQNVIIDDITAPVADLATLADITAECQVTSLTAPTATDNCGGTVTVTNDATLPITSEGTTVIIWTYDDGNGNTSTQTQNVIIDDISGPTPNLDTLTAITAECGIDSLLTPGATDNCGGLVTITNDAVLPITAQGTTIITWTYADEHGNLTTQEQLVIIADTTAPMPMAENLDTIYFSCPLEAIGSPEATDNCSDSITVSTETEFPISETTTITWIFDDGNGNMSTQTQVVLFDPIDVSTTLEEGGITIVANNATADNWQWINCEDGSEIDGETNSSFTATENGSYAVIITEGTCSDTSECIDITTVSIEKIEIANIRIYPNPVKGSFFTIETNQEINQIILTDMNGRIIGTTYNAFDGTVHFDTIESGNYIVTLSTINGTTLRKQLIIFQ